MVGIVFNIVNVAFDIFTYILIARIILSWVPSMQYTTIAGYIYKITEPYLAIFRSFIPPIGIGGGGLDLSPIVAFIALYFLRIGVNSILIWVFNFVGLIG